MAMLSLAAVQLIYATATAMAAVFALILWNNRETPGAVALAGTCISAGVWSASSFGISVL